MESMRWLFALTAILYLKVASPASSVEFDEYNAVEIDLNEEYKVSPAIPPEFQKNVYFLDTFDKPEEVAKRWIKSEAKKPEAAADIEQYDGKWRVEPMVNYALKGDLGLVVASANRHSAIAAPLSRPFKFNNSPLVIQYEVAFQDKLDCGGGYIKLLTNEKHDLKKFNNLTPYSIMFGPDICGSKSKIHFILNYKNPKTGKISEKHCNMLKAPNSIFQDKQPHLFRLVVRPDNTYAFYLDRELKHEGNATQEDEFEPSILPPLEIVDETDKKPEEWDEREKIPDPEAVKPDDWDETLPATIVDPAAEKPAGWLDDEPEFIPDPNAIRPDDWDADMDGEWEPAKVENPLCKTAPGCGPWSPPIIPNPDYKGPWRAPLIDNPNYKGKWYPRKIPNPEYYDDKKVFSCVNIGAVGFELWSLSKNIYFDNILLTDSVEYADQLTQQTYTLKADKFSAEGQSWFDSWFSTASNGKSKIPTWNEIKKYFQENPWMYAVTIAVVLLPLVLYCTFCCGSRKSKQDKESSARAKKTDEVVADDAVEAEMAEGAEPEEINEDEESDGERRGVSNQEQDQEGDDEERNSQEDSTDSSAYNGKDEESTSTEAPDSPVAGAGDAPKAPKRRARRD
ncbi:unnamed protein product [Bemisia tabaci]|uniref:Calnexin n=1 Tax=Bemisia tabaci TaxID=7038 RepID=A0A9P0ADI3_BEMTA|nr:unnamed protein product [Bemisia tabaci]